MSSPRRYARLRTWAGCLGLRLAIVGFVVVVTAAFAAAVLQRIGHESP